MIRSLACDAVVAAAHPSPEDGGPCATCAFRDGTEASQTAHTVTLARLCVEGFRQFHCHERPQLCRGYVAAANLRGVPATKKDAKRAERLGIAADVIAEAIAAAKAVEES